MSHETKLVNAVQFVLVNFLDKAVKKEDGNYTTGRIELKNALKDLGYAPAEPDIHEALKKTVKAISEID